MATTEDKRDVGGTDDWKRELYDAAPERTGELFSTISGLENDPLYTPDAVEVDYDRDVGREGVAIDSLADMETLFEGIPLGEVSTSMTINAPAAMLLAFYVCVGEQQDVARAELRGTIQTDILKEYIAQKEWIFPPEPSMRLVTDMVEFCARELPRWHPISISAYPIPA